jgi:Fe-S cluster assembly iron-binding protein IscA
MLTLTRDAAEAVRAIAVASPEVPDDSGLRIRRRDQEGAEPGLELTMVENPEADDAVVEAEGARVFVDAELAPELDDKVLDAAVVGDQVQFTLSNQT